MGLLILGFFVLVSVVVLGIVVGGKGNLESDIKKLFRKINSQEESPYIKKKYFLTDTEKKFYLMLDEWFGKEYYIFPQVNIASIISVSPDKARDYTYLNKIDRKSIDFVLFDKLNMLPVLAIELDDYTHNFSNRVERDRFVDEVLKMVGLPILHVSNIQGRTLEYKEKIDSFLTENSKVAENNI